MQRYERQHASGRTSAAVVAAAISLLIAATFTVIWQVLQNSLPAPGPSDSWRQSATENRHMWWIASTTAGWIAVAWYVVAVPSLVVAWYGHASEPQLGREDAATSRALDR